MISVVITVHPPLLKHLRRCVDSVLWQLMPGDECVVVSDGCELPVECDGPWLKKVCLTVAHGVSSARNYGALHVASGKWIKFLDADDLLAPFALNAFRAIEPKLPEKVAVVAGSQIKVHNGIVQGTQDPPDIARVIAHANPILVSMAFVRREAALRVRGFDERIEFEEDWDFWLRLRQAGWQFAIHRRPFCCYCVDDAERAAKVRSHQVEGMDVREYLARTYGIKPS